MPGDMLDDMRRRGTLAGYRATAFLLSPPSMTASGRQEMGGKENQVHRIHELDELRAKSVEEAFEMFRDHAAELRESLVGEVVGLEITRVEDGKGRWCT